MNNVHYTFQLDNHLKQAFFVDCESNPIVLVLNYCGN